MSSSRPSSFRPLLCALILSLGHAPLVAQVSEPIDIGIGDLDQDSYPDVFTANRFSDEIVWHPNPGTGVLLAPVGVSLGPSNIGAIAAAHGDLDGDGLADDCAVACDISDTIALVFDVTGTPTVQTVAAGGILPRDVVVTELDGVAPAEVIIGREGNALGSGAGLAVIRAGGPAQEIPMPPGPARVIRIAPADLDNDGFIDLAVAVAGRNEMPDRVLLFGNDGLGGLTFAGRIIVPSVDRIAAVTVGDLDSDGWRDFAVLIKNNSSTTNLIRVYHNDGSGVLAPSAFTVLNVQSPGHGGLDLALGDLDGDGLGEAVVVNGETRDVVAHEGFSMSGFASVRTLTTALGPVAAVIDDVNGDALDDVVVSDGQAAQILVLRSPGPRSPSLSILGPGCAGSAGAVPQIDTPLPATAGQPAFPVNLSQALPASPAFLFASPIPNQVVLPSGCTIWLTLPAGRVAATTSASGTAQLLFPIPNTASVMGAQMSFQWVVIDTRGTSEATLSVSGGLEITIGS